MMLPLSPRRLASKRRRAITIATLDEASLLQLAEIRSSANQSVSLKRVVRRPSAEKLFVKNKPRRRQSMSSIDLHRRRRQSIVSIEPREDVKSLEFDILATRKSLEQVAYDLYASFGLLTRFGISDEVFHEFISSVKSGYCDYRHNKSRKKSDPAYHSFRHAVDVAQAACMFLHSAELRASQRDGSGGDDGSNGELLSPLDQFSLLTAALCHDIGHGGWSNAFLAATRSEPTAATAAQPELALEKERAHSDVHEPDLDLVAQYGEVGTLERYHAHLSELLLTREGPGARLLAPMGEESGSRVVRRVRALVLATDMAQHGRYVEALRAVQAGGGFRAKAEAEAKVSNSDSDDNSADGGTLLLMQCLLKLADISNVGRPFDVTAAWAHSLAAEFQAQGRHERECGLPVTPLNVAPLSAKANMVAGFVDFLARPFADLVAAVLAMGEAKDGADAGADVGGAAGGATEATAEAHAHVHVHGHGRSAGSALQAFARGVACNREVWRRVQQAEADFRAMQQQPPPQNSAPLDDECDEHAHEHAHSSDRLRGGDAASVPSAESESESEGESRAKHEQGQGQGQEPDAPSLPHAKRRRSLSPSMLVPPAPAPAPAPAPTSALALTPAHPSPSPRRRSSCPAVVLHLG